MKIRFVLPVVAMIVAGMTLFSCGKEDDKTPNNTVVPDEGGEGGGDGGGQQTRIEGSLSGVFSISATQKVRFSQGNLQFTTTGRHAVVGDTIDGTWRFAPNQWDTIGGLNDSVSPTYAGWIDLFGWGTSGYNNKFPYMTSTTPADYGDGAVDIAGTNYDWGVYNAISNGGNQPGLWRTPTRGELTYMLYGRDASTIGTTANARHAKAFVNNVPGLIIFPDVYTHPTTVAIPNDINRDGANYTANNYNTSDWSLMATAGAVFLPAAGNRSGTQYRDSHGYWTSDYYSSGRMAYYMYIGNENLNPYNYTQRHYGYSVRLITDVQ